MHACIRTYILHACIHTYIHTYIHVHIHTQTDRQTVRQTDSHACMHAYKHTYIHTCIHTYIHTHRHTYKHTDLHTYVHTYIQYIPLRNVRAGRDGRGRWSEKKKNANFSWNAGIRIRVDYGNGPGTQYDVSGVISLSSWLYVGLRDVERDSSWFWIESVVFIICKLWYGWNMKSGFMKVFALSCFCQHGLSEQHLERSSCGRLVAAVHRCSGDKGYGQKAESGFLVCSG